jgi:TP53 regulating kinase and related kinases
MTKHQASGKRKLLSQGAEAKIFLDNNTIIKKRTRKYYRHPKLDEQIRTRRTRSESKILTKAIEAKANTPKVLNTEKFQIEMEYIEGDKISEKLNSYSQEEQIKIMKKIGKQLSILHKNDIIHGDLTTSNLILSKNKVFIIDFGLSSISTKIENKAVDIHLIKRALEAKHFRSPDHPLGENFEKLFEFFCKGYKWRNSEEIMGRLKIVESRGRYKH